MTQNTRRRVKKISTFEWTIKLLLELFVYFLKPKYQRKMKWSVKPTNDAKKANFREYIDFLMKYKNSQIPIALGKTDGCPDYTVSDGNNRIHAIISFIRNPYKLYGEWYNEIIDYIKYEPELTGYKDILIGKIKSISYTDIYNCTFDEACIDNTAIDENFQVSRKVNKHLQVEFKNLKEKFLFGHKDKFDCTEAIKIVVNLFENFTYEELSQNYLEVHSKLQKMDEFDLLAASLGSIKTFIIEDTILKENLKLQVKAYYENRVRDDEILKQYKVDDEFTWSAFDFLLAYQEYCAKKYNVFLEIDFEKEFDIRSIPFIFRLFDVIICENNGLKSEYFTTENINSFIKKTDKSFKRLQNIINEMYPDLNENSTVKIYKTNKLGKHWQSVQALLLSSILASEKYNDTLLEKNQIKRIIHFHFFLKTITIANASEATLERRAKLAQQNWLDTTRDIIRGNPNTYSRKLYNDPSFCLRNAPTKTDLKRLMTWITKREIKKNKITLDTKRKGKKRKAVSVLNYVLMADYWFAKMPGDYIQQIKNTGVILHNDHLVPFSTNTDIPLTLDRLGNFSPIMATINCARKNGHISIYWNDPKVKKIIQPLNIIPDISTYDNIVIYKKHGTNNNTYPHIKNHFMYNTFCEQNEEKYINSFLERLFRDN